MCSVAKGRGRLGGWVAGWLGCIRRIVVGVAREGGGALGSIGSAHADRFCGGYAVTSVDSVCDMCRDSRSDWAIRLTWVAACPYNSTRHDRRGGMDRKSFEQLIVATLDALPAEFARHLDSVNILLEDAPTAQQWRELELAADETVYGYYEGVPLTEQSSDDYGLPATIVIFQQPLERDFPDPDELRREVRTTVLHELAHHFGISDERLLELGAY